MPSLLGRWFWPLTDRWGLTETVVHVGDELTEFWHKGFAAYLMTVACLFMVSALDSSVPIWPITHYTAVWAVALFFPITALLFLTFSLRTRFKEIHEVACANLISCVYYPGVSAPDADRRFSRYLRKRFTEYYNPLELAAWSLTAGAIVFLVALYLAVQFYIVRDAGTALARVEFPGAALRWELATGAGFLGGLVGAFALILKKYRTFDIYPSTYGQAAVGIVVGMASGGMVAALYPAAPMMFVAFTTAFLATIHVNFLPRFLRGAFAWVTKTELPPDLKSDLDRVIRNSEAIETLNNIGIYAVADLVKTDPVRLYLNLPHPIGVINGWLDEAMLQHYCEPHASRLAEIPFRRFTQLLDRMVDKIAAPSLQWTAVPIIGDATADAGLLSAIQSVIYSGTHHRLLGCICPVYRAAFFPAGQRIPSPQP